MSLSNPYAQYRQNAIDTATPTRLVVMLYDGAVRFLSQALPEMQAHKLYEQSLYIGKAQAIIAHLWGTLDFNAGGEVAQNLAEMYAKMHAALTEANIDDNPVRVEEVIMALRSLRDAWIEVDIQCQSRKNSAPAGRERLELIAA